MKKKNSSALSVYFTGLSIFTLFQVSGTLIARFYKGTEIPLAIIGFIIFLFTSWIATYFKLISKDPFLFPFMFIPGIEITTKAVKIFIIYSLRFILLTISLSMSTSSAEELNIPVGDEIKRILIITTSVSLTYLSLIYNPKRHYATNTFIAYFNFYSCFLLPFFLPLIIFYDLLQGRRRAWNTKETTS